MIRARFQQHTHIMSDDLLAQTLKFDVLWLSGKPIAVKEQALKAIPPRLPTPSLLVYSATRL
jgi:hypothetical protein